MALNPYFASSYTQGENSEQELLEDMVTESIDIMGQELRYIPRKYVAKNDILGEDRLSKFEHSYSVNCYFDNINSFDGSNMFISKFGHMMEQSATLSISKKSWEWIVGEAGNSILPNRPAEGDLMYFPLTKGLFEIKFVDHMDPFFQLGQQYVWKLRVELYQYSSEHISTGEEEIDAFESLKTHDISLVDDIDEVESFGDNTKFKDQGSEIVWSNSNPFGEVN